MWGPRVDDARWLWSERVLDLVVARVGTGADRGDVIAGEPGWSPRVQGTAGYIAPEVAEGRRVLASDVFSFAVMTWGLLFGQPPSGGPPPNASTSAAVMVQIERARAGLLDLDVLDRRGAASAVVSALRPALVSEPEDRPTLAELLARLESMLAPKGMLGRLRARVPRHFMGRSS